jgi:hypothetical protein
MLHRTPIEQWIEATNVVEMRGQASLCGLDHCRLGIPENSGGLGLSERQETLASGNETCDGLVQVSNHHSFFAKFKRSTDQTESGTVLDDVRMILIRFPISDFQSTPNNREIS